MSYNNSFVIQTIDTIKVKTIIIIIYKSLVQILSVKLKMFIVQVTTYTLHDVSTISLFLFILVFSGSYVV